jgi:hypothetical protein
MKIKQVTPGDILSYLEMCAREGVSLQRGMNFRLKGQMSVILMSIRKGAPYADRVEDEGRILIYEGHDVPKSSPQIDPKLLDQPALTPGGKHTQNGLFFQAASAFKSGKSQAELVRVYEKIRNGIWAYNGVFKLIDAWEETAQDRRVYKFKLEITEDAAKKSVSYDLGHDRVIPTTVKLEVWKRDKGCCRECGRSDNLHFDHVIPFSLGGSSIVAENIQILCARHNLEKSDDIK